MVRLGWQAVGGDPAPGDPAAFDEIASSFAETAANAGEAHGRLTRLASSVDDSIWRGEAADAFRSEIGELPPLLAKLHESYQAAAEGMAAYGRVLGDLQAQARMLLSQAQAAQDEQAAAQRARDQAVAQDPLAPTAAFEQAIGDAQRRAASLRSQLEEVRERRRAAENAAIASLEHAGELGIRNDPWYKRAWEGFEGWIDDHADVLRGFSTALKWVSGAAGLLSFIPVLAPVFVPIAVTAGAAAFVLDAALVATGKGDWKALAVDSALMALPVAGRLISRAIKGGGVGRAGGGRLLSRRPRGAPVARTYDDLSRLGRLDDLGRIELRPGHHLDAEHVFRGQVSPKGKAGGFHHYPSRGDSARIVPGTRGPRDPHGVYRARVEIRDPATGKWVRKKRASTFFPDDWSAHRVLEEIGGAFDNKVMTSKNRWEGISPSGVRIRGYLNSDGTIPSAHPVLPGS